jgi:hypothetical protein
VFPEAFGNKRILNYWQKQENEAHRKLPW